MRANFVISFYNFPPNQTDNKIYYFIFFSSQATKDALTGQYSFEDGEGGTRDQYLKDNSITTYIITGFNDLEIQNNNDVDKCLEKRKHSSPQKTLSIGSPVLSVTNLPKIFVTNAANEDSNDVTTEGWAPEIPFENLTGEAPEEMIGGNTLGPH